MNALARDLGILGVLIVVGLIWSLYGVVTRRHQRRRTTADTELVARDQAHAQPIPGLAAHAASMGWAGPSTEPPPDEVSADYVREMARTLAGEASVLLPMTMVLVDKARRQVRVDAITIHQAVFLIWAVVTGLHVLGRFLPTLRLTLAVPAGEPTVPGASRRALTLVVVAAIAAAAGPVVLFAAGSWQVDRHGHDRGQPIISQRIFLRSASAAATAPVAAPAPAAPTRLARAALRPVR